MTYKVVRDASNNVICYGPNDDGYDPVLKVGNTLTIEEIIPQATSQQQRDVIQAQIKQLEDESNMNRFVREGMIEVSIKEAAVFGYTEPQLYIANYGYKLVKNLNTQITTLRNQMAAII